MGLAGHMAAELGSIFRGLVEAFPPNHLHDAMGRSIPAWILPADARVELRIGGRPGTVPTGRCPRDPGCGSPSRATIGTGPDGPRTAPPSGSMPSDPGKVGPTSAKSSGGEWTVSAPMRGSPNGSLGHLLSCTYGRIARPSCLDVDVQVAGSRILAGGPDGHDRRKRDRLAHPAFSLDAERAAVPACTVAVLFVDLAGRADEAGALVPPVGGAPGPRPKRRSVAAAPIDVRCPSRWPPPTGGRVWYECSSPACGGQPRNQGAVPQLRSRRGRSTRRPCPDPPA